MNIYDTLTMLEGLKAVKPVPSFLKDNYFPTTENDMFTTEKVVVDFENESNDKLAPAVVKDPVPVQRDSFQSHDYTAPLIAPSIELSVEQLNRRVFNESIVSNMTPEQREAQYLADDLTKMENMITRMEEWMAAQTLLNNAYTIKQYVNGYGTTLSQDFSINFYGEGYTENQAVYTSTGWTADSKNIISDIANMCDALLKKGYVASDVIMGANAASMFLNNSEIRDELDNRRIRITDELRQELVIPGVAHIGRFDFNGHVVDIYNYAASYTDNATGQTAYYFDADKVVVTAKGMGRTAYGAITQYEENAVEATTYAQRRVPHVVINRRSGVRELILQSRPLVMPKRLNSAIVSKVIL